MLLAYSSKYTEASATLDNSFLYRLNACNSCSKPSSNISLIECVGTDPAACRLTSCTSGVRPEEFRCWRGHRVGQNGGACGRYARQSRPDSGALHQRAAGRRARASLRASNYGRQSRPLSISPVILSSFNLASTIK